MKLTKRQRNKIPGLPEDKIRFLNEKGRVICDTDDAPLLLEFYTFDDKLKNWQSKQSLSLSHFVPLHNPEKQEMIDHSLY